MGFGDEIMATGMARGAKDRGKRIAFGDGKRIIWSHWSKQIFRGNPNIAKPGDEHATDLEWIAHYGGHRLYNSLDQARTRWVWNEEFRPIAGEMFFSDEELRFAALVGSEFVVIEPNVPRQKSVAPNKDWGAARYQAVADHLTAAGHRVVQFGQGRDRLKGVGAIQTLEFRQALAVLSRASLYIGPEGGLHHGAAAIKRRASDAAVISRGAPAVVLFGGFIPPQVTGYDTHTNLTGGADACGSLNPCSHCRAAMDSIGVEMVCEAAISQLAKSALETV